MKKQKYSQPQITVILSDPDDVILTSNGQGGGGIVLPDDEWQ